MWKACNVNISNLVGHLIFVSNAFNCMHWFLVKIRRHTIEWQLEKPISPRPRLQYPKTLTRLMKLSDYTILFIKVKGENVKTACGYLAQSSAPPLATEKRYYLQHADSCSSLLLGLSIKGYKQKIGIVNNVNAFYLAGFLHFQLHA